MSSNADSPSSEAFPIPEIVPVFPLPNVVFFPHTYLPLHIFEPRYRDMVDDAVSGGQCIGMALLKDGWEEHYYEAPPIFELGCVGRMTTVQKLSDGRFNIVLEGLRRCTYHEETVPSRYRQAKISLYPRHETDELENSLRNKVTEAAEIYLQTKKVPDLCQIIASGRLSDRLLVNSLSAGLDFTPIEKQFLLESDHLSQQARRLLDLIRLKLPNLHSSAQG